MFYLIRLSRVIDNLFFCNGCTKLINVRTFLEMNTRILSASLLHFTIVEGTFLIKPGFQGVKDLSGKGEKSAKVTVHPHCYCV